MPQCRDRCSIETTNTHIVTFCRQAVQKGKPAISDNHTKASHICRKQQCPQQHCWKFGIHRFTRTLHSKYKVPGRKFLGQEMEKVLIEIKAKASTFLQEATKVSIYADIWSKRGLTASFLGVNAHFFQDETTRGTHWQWLWGECHQLILLLLKKQQQYCYRCWSQ